MRHTGIPIIGDVPWGTHFCQFYQDRQDLIDILVPYFKAGLENNEFCMWVTSDPLQAEEAKAALARDVEGLENYIRDGQLEILDYSQWYTVGGKFESDRVLKGWVDRLDAATQRGFDGLRLSGNTFWLEKSDWQDFTQYEAAVDRVIGQYRMLAICTYSLARCGAVEIMDVLSNHSFALIKRAGDWQIVESAERRKAEASLRESEERLAMAVASTGLGTWDFDPPTGKLIWSDLCKLHFGLPPEAEVNYDIFLGGLHPGDRERIDKAVQNVLRPESGGQFAVEYRTVGFEDGQERSIGAMGRAFFDREGRPVRFIGTTLDLTSRKRAEEALRESEERRKVAEAVEAERQQFNDILDKLPMRVCLLTPDHQVLFANRRFRDFFGESNSRRCFEYLFHRSDPCPECQAFTPLSTHEPHHWEWDTPTGAYVDIYNLPFTGPDGSPLILEVDIDITERKRIEAELAKHRERLEELVKERTCELEQANARLQSEIAERKRAGETIRHQNTTLEAINRIFSEALSSEPEEKLGRRCRAVAEQATGSKFGFIGEINAEGRLDDIAISDPGWKACSMDGPTGHDNSPDNFEVHGLYGRVLDGKGFFTNDPGSHPDTIGTPEGHPSLKSFLGVPLKYDSKTIGMIAVANREGGYRARDQECLEALAVAVVQVLMRERAERAVREGEERLRQAQKMESIGVLAGGIAHDFNNLLTSILGNASLLQMDSPAANGHQLNAIIECSEKAAALTRQLLAYAGKGQFEITDFDVSRLVRSSADLLRVSIPKNIHLSLDVPRNLPAVRGDASQIQQVVMNMVINAAEAIEGRGNGKVSISARIRDFDYAAGGRVDSGIAPGRYISIEVGDNGCGMDEQTKAKIFDPFFTTKFTGRGLGLAAVHGILRSHKGAITVESQPGQGSTFAVYLPCSQSREAGSCLNDALTAGCRSAVVLVVDDEEAVRGFTKAALKRLGCSVLIAQNGREALDLLNTHANVDLVILDIVMPVVGGVEAFSEMRKKWPELGVLVASGYSRQEALRLGLPPDLPFIEKPYTVQRLAAAVEKSLQAVQPSRDGLQPARDLSPA